MLEQGLKLCHELKDTLPVGQFGLIHGDKLAGAYPTEAQAIGEGARQFGRKPYLVKQVLTQEPVVSNPALTLGILRAIPTLSTPR